MRKKKYILSPSELRLGNYVYVPATDQQTTISTVTQHLGITVNNSLARIGVEEIEPIVLTSDWIAKFGFELQQTYTSGELWSIKCKSRRYWSIFKKEEYIHFEDFPACLREPDFYWSFHDNHHDIEIRYVHQLQNLFYAITHTELEYNPDAVNSKNKKKKKR